MAEFGRMDPVATYGLEQFKVRSTPNVYIVLRTGCTSESRDLDLYILHIAVVLS